MNVLDGRPEIWHGSLLQGPPSSDARSPGRLEAKAPAHTPIGTAVERIRHPYCMLPCMSPANPPDQTMTSGPNYPFATKPRGLSNVLKRFQAPILDPQPQRPTTEWSRGDKAACGEQIQQKCHRVERSSGRAEAQATSHPVWWPGSNELWQISTRMRRMEERKGLDRVDTISLVRSLLIWHPTSEVNAITHLWCQCPIQSNLRHKIPHRSGTAFLVARRHIFLGEYALSTVSCE